MQDLQTNSVWLLIADRLETQLRNAKEGCTHLTNTPLKDLELKCKVAIIKELLNLPQEMNALAANERGTNVRS